MKVVLDSNVYLSAFASRGLCVEILRVCSIRHEIILSEHLLAEVRKGFIRKLKMPEAAVERNVHSIKTLGRIEVPAEVPNSSCRDPKDLPVLGLALTSHADYLVSGDEDLQILKKFHKTIILSPRGFWETMSKRP